MGVNLLELLRRYDKTGIYNVYLRWHELLSDTYRVVRESFSVPREINVHGKVIRYGDINKVVICGMGGSGIVGDLVYDMYQDVAEVPIVVIKDYHLPRFCDERTLVIAISYSGNTEETISAFVEGIERGCQVVSVSSGGVLEEFAKKLGTPHVAVPRGTQPRAALPCLVAATLAILEKFNVIGDTGGDVKECSAVLRDVIEENRPEVGGRALELANAIGDKVPFICGHTFYRGVAIRLKNEFNENSKVVAVASTLPEFDHNDIVGWELKPSNVVPVFIRDRDEDEVTRARVTCTEDVLRSLGLRIEEIWARGRSRLAKVLSLCLLGGLASVYLAVLRGLDPGEVVTISLLKRYMSEKLRVVESLRKRLCIE
ncbi:MAG: bifunctional phosphoglucose/phosphomannose isomerase [Thermoprotei archaeon]|nr:MAG: bifunctional phosphoglucose/phosphomannose isomerase [Thermoprotei archaeon]